MIRVHGSYSDGALTSPKSGKVRSVPMAPDVARVLAALGQRLDWTGDDDLVFPGEGGDYLDGSALRRRHAAALRRAGLRQLGLAWAPTGSDKRRLRVNFTVP